MKKFIFWVFVLTSLASTLGVLLAIKGQNWWGIPKNVAVWCIMLGVMKVVREDSTLTKKSLLSLWIGVIVGAVVIIRCFIVGEYIDASAIGMVMLVGVWNIEENKKDKNLKWV